MIKYRSRTHYTLMMLRSANGVPKTLKTLLDITSHNVKPSRMRESLDILVRQGLANVVTVSERRGYRSMRRDIEVEAWQITAQGVDALLKLARNQERSPSNDDVTNVPDYNKMRARETAARRTRA